MAEPYLYAHGFESPKMAASRRLRGRSPQASVGEVLVPGFVGDGRGRAICGAAGWDEETPKSGPTALLPFQPATMTTAQLAAVFYLVRYAGRTTPCTPTS